MVYIIKAQHKNQRPSTSDDSVNRSAGCANCNASVRRPAQSSMRQSIAGRLSIILFGSEALTFEDQVEGCKCAPMDKAMAHPRRSELVDLSDLEISRELDKRPVNSDEAKATSFLKRVFSKGK